MAEEEYEETVYSDSESDDEETSLVDDDGMTAEEEGFLKGYEEAAIRSRASEAEEEELE